MIQPTTPLPRVLVVAEYGWRNGGENSWLCVAEKLHNTSVSFIVACPAATEFANYLGGLGIPTIDLQFYRSDGEQLVRKSQDEIREHIGEIIKFAEPDLVHANSLASSRLVGPVTQELAIPSIGYLRDIIKISKTAIRDINCLDQVIAVSNATLQFHREHGLGSDKSAFIHNGVDLDRFCPKAGGTEFQNELGLDPATRLLLCIGQVGLRKGTDAVIKAFGELRERHPDLALLIVGQRHSVKDEAVEFESHCRELGESVGNVFWLGRRSDIPGLMNAAHLLLHAARQEPLGRVLLESLACGLPMVATDVGGTKEIVSEDLWSSVLVEPDSVHQMVAKAGQILSDDSLHSKLSSCFRQIAIRQFDIGRCAQALDGVYKKLLAR